MTLTRILACAASFVLPTLAAADDVRITTFKDDVTFTMNGQSITINRTQDLTATLQGDFARIARPCPTDCIQPMQAANGVRTLGELELLTFLTGSVSNSQGLLIDARDAGAFARDAIPGAVNVPFGTLSEENRFRVDILRALGAVGTADNLDFSGALDLAIYSGGPWSADAVTAIQHLIASGYPPEKLHYYRGGLQAWLHLGLTSTRGQTPG